MDEQVQSADSYTDAGDSRGKILEKLTQKAEKIETETGIDWISELPDSLIVQILSLLHITDACKTTVLSKRWQYLWTFIDNVVFDSRMTNWSNSLKVNKFISFTDSVLCHLSCSNIRKFSLSLLVSDGDVSACSSKIDKLLELAVHKKVKDLDLYVWYRDQQPYNLPQVLCSSSSILKLNVRNCRISEERIINWTSLKSLTLECLLLGDEHIEQIISNCPLLESLKLNHFCGFHHLHITSPKCRSLELITHGHPFRERDSFGGNCGYLEIVAPYIQHLKISGDFYGMEVRLGDLSSLVHANLTFTIDKVFDKTIVKDHLISLRSADELTVPSWYIEVIAMLTLENEDYSLPLLECKQLTINSWISERSLLGIANLLRSTSYLENLIIRAEGYDSFIEYWDKDIKLLGYNYLSLQKNMFKGLLQNLKNAKVISEFCCYDMVELPGLLKSLLELAINLETLVISTEHTSCDDCPTKISKMIQELLAFPRSSDRLVVSSGDPVDFDSE